MTKTSQPPDFSRRSVLASATVGAGALTLAFTLAPRAAFAQAAATHSKPEPKTEPRVAAQAPSPVEIHCWIVIRPDETVVIRVARSEMGQGAFTALPMLVAEELECDWAKVRAEYAPPAENLERQAAWKRHTEDGAPPSRELLTHWSSMATGGSQGTTSSQQYLREAGAIARTMLVEAAAKDWGVSASECTAASGVVTHAASGRKASYAALAPSAARLMPPGKVTLKDPKSWRICGKPARQINAGAKVDGSLTYAIDVRLADMLHATIAQCPVFGGKLKAFDEAKAKAMPGVRFVLKLDDATLCVAADTFWQARRGLDAAHITWDEGPNAKLSSLSIAELQHDGLAAREAFVAFRIGDATTVLSTAQRRIAAEYGTPFLAHATMEPMNCTARVADGKVEIWVGTQDGEGALIAAAEAAGVRPEQVTVNKRHLGGGFGRRGAPHDFVRFAVLAARRTGGRPVKLVYTREEDLTHDFYRPASRARLEAALDDKGMPTALAVRIAGQSIAAWQHPDRVKVGDDPEQSRGFQEGDIGYAFPHVTIEVATRNTPVPVGFWRSVNSSQNAFYKESFIDEIAYAGGSDPFALRRALLANAPRQKRVLEIAAEKAGWGKPLPPGVGRGIAVETACGSCQAVVAEVRIGETGELKVLRLVNAIDCGHVVNPNTVEQQMQGAAVMAMSALLYGESTVDKGRMLETNFDTYRLMKLDEMPTMENHIVPSFEFWGGVGEAGVPPIAPAICNAIFAATGKRIRSLPLKNHKLARA